jgi:hypothetical protein
MKEERVVRTNDVISYTVTKSLKEVGRENFWWLFSLSLLWGYHCFLADVGKGVLVLATCLVIFQVKQTALYENFTLFRGTGIQVESVNLLATKQKAFIEQNKIAAVVINEAVTPVDVYYYLCVVVEHEDEVATAFPTCKPGLDFIVEVYQEAKIFFPPKF